MGLYDLKAGFPGGYSRVIFSNGLQDPWSAGGSWKPFDVRTIEYNAKQFHVHVLHRSCSA
eukprot:m.524781 g.524781  ORF g.524781 m.524781 type:complete len:60 (+) comp21992_c0_seq3:106-285(+)